MDHVLCHLVYSHSTNKDTKHSNQNEIKNASMTSCEAGEISRIVVHVRKSGFATYFFSDFATGQAFLSLYVQINN